MCICPWRSILNKYTVKCYCTHHIYSRHMCHFPLLGVSEINHIPSYKWLKRECAVALLPRAWPNQMLRWNATCLGKSSVSQCGGDWKPVWSCQCLPFQGSHLIDGSCHKLNRSIFLLSLRMLTLDCKQTCCWVTTYQPPSVVGLDLLEETSFLLSVFFVIKKYMSASASF